MRKDRLKRFFLLFILTILWYSAPLHAQFLEIWEIQSNTTSSPYNQEVVTTVQNIVTAVGDDHFFMQTPPDRSDNDPTTSDGILVNINNPDVLVGDLVSVSGRINEVDGNTQFNALGLQLDIVDVGQTLPPVVDFDQSFPSITPSNPHPLEAVEGMIVSFVATAAGPSTGADLAPLYTTESRPFREPGIQFPGMSGTPVWDGNPELFWIDPDGLNQPNNRFIETGMTVSGEGPMIQDNFQYIVTPSTYSISGDGILTQVRDKNLGEISVGSFNVLMLNSNSGNFQTKLRKLSKYIVESMKAPDIVALQELANSNSLGSLRNFILQNYGINYSNYFEQSGGNINTGFLVKNTITDIVVTQLGENENISLGGPLHDRPPLLLTGNIVSEPEIPIQVLNLHMRSLIDIEGDNSFFVRTKRHEQAISIANMIQDRQDENLIVVGDFNAYQFSDGYVDVVNQITGQESLGAIFTNQDIVNPPIINYTNTLPESERYSFVFRGNAQTLDHCLSVSQLDGLEVVEVQYARGNADQPEAFENNSQVVNRASDHDGLVAFIQVENPITSTSSINRPDFDLQFNNPMSTSDQITIIGNSSSQKINYRWMNQQGQVLEEGVSSMTDVIHLPKGIHSGMYWLQIADGEQSKTRKIIVQ